MNEKILLVTGSSRGIGAATAILAAKKEYSICLNYLNDEKSAFKVRDEILNLGAKCITVRADVSNEHQVKKMFDDIDTQLGSITHLVNNVGILKQKTPLIDMDGERFQQVLLTNVMSHFYCSSEAIKRMSISRGGSGGSIVNVSSGASKSGSPFEYIDYAASKGAVDTFTTGLSKEVAADGIRVNCVRPGGIYTDIHADGGEPSRVDRIAKNFPMQRGGTPEEVANAILWLLSDEASFVTGSFTDLCGGL
ncbi:SDR family oxidoreductase [Xenorhabdus bovienii]|uniref:SDR family oxidoreductase n=1 Tax=Xenorhabdus bovienii TaxID=40576 RepID=UPI00237C77BC|nr:SDR family oxidoreductase [Xenorhabdus bovienii]MDE1483548.1 SDR family oxidoreductase [Xenorhabdus bovienii]MDE9428981.1 SDR family oxidoreductase [Xenorhabdus bovienii]MDE9434385.1 SDR family oxidoreductase [Xenorhabdus bovienii]MDE9442420.1 SDR family oxidoreductase [Xenorhabdus bovienii]MDE9462753.1 SDR family oxidoreductase [Xenorhabdus bovienii]